MRLLSLVFIFIYTFQIGTAQYTYITDRRFFTTEDLVGYDFRPSMMEVPHQSEQDLSPGEYSFGISFNNLYVEGEDLRGVYNINNISPTEYGFKLLLMNARDARLQGHLKVILNKYAMVELLIFKRSPEEKEIIFYLPAISTKLRAQEKAYFTDRGEMFLEDTDSLWGKKIFPFFRIHLDQNVQEPLAMGDSTSISFERIVTIEEKEKKSKEKKAKEEVLVEESINSEPEVMTEDVTEKKVKIITEYFVIIRSIVKYSDGGIEDKTWKYPIRKVSQKEDKYAKEYEEKYQWTLASDKIDLILYLNGDNSVSSFEVGEKRYLMRGF